jgi:hypothetical protein
MILDDPEDRLCLFVRACSTTGAASLGYPSGEPAAFAAAPSSGCASLEHPTCVGCPTSSSTAGQPSGSDRCFLAWLDRWQASGLHRMLRTADRLAADFPTCVGVRPPARPAITPDSHLVSSFSSAGLTASSSHRLPSQPPACAGCCCSSNSRWRLPPVATPASNLRLASAALLPALPVSAHPACAACAYLRLGL